MSAPVSVYEDVDITKTAPSNNVEKQIITKDIVNEVSTEPRIAISFLHSFKRAEIERSETFELSARRPGNTSHLHRKLRGRHLQMIAIGGAIGAGLFIGSGKALAVGGPGAVVLDFGLIGMMLFCTINALGELATLFPVQGQSEPGFTYNRIIFDFLHEIH
jgi:amino acid permease